MPSNYTGDPTATEPPSDPPNPEEFPILALPVDGDPPNASTFAQAYKVLADFVAWLFKPRAESGQYHLPIVRYRTAALHARATIDHLGFPGGRFIQWREWLSGILSVGGTFASTTVPEMPGWRYDSDEGASQTAEIVIGVPDLGVTGMHRFVEFNTDGAATFVRLSRLPACAIQDDNHIVLEWEMKLEDPSATDTVYYAGFGVNNSNGSPAATPDAESNFIRVFKSAGGDWQFEVNDGASSQVAVTGFNDADWHRWRLEWHGVNVAEDATAAARVFVDGSLAATITTNLPVDAQATVVFARKSDAASADQRLYIGPSTFNANTWPADVI